MSLSLRNLRFAWPTGPLVLDDITLDMPSGARIAVIGANGSGKSTLARCIAGLIAPGRPESILWQGRPIQALGHAGRVAQVQMVGQRPDLQLSGRAGSVRAEVAFGPENLGLPRSEIATRVAAALEAMIGSFADRRRLRQRLLDHPHRTGTGRLPCR